MKIPALLITLAAATALAATPAPPASQPAATTSRPAANRIPYAPATLPGNGLKQHDFMYAGEAAPLQIFIIKDGKVAWQYTHPKPARGAGEISDATLLSNGNILFAFQFGAAIVTPDKKILWSLDAEPNCEIHTAQFLPATPAAGPAAAAPERVVLIQNGNPAKLLTYNITTNTKLSEVNLPTGNPNSVHGQFRSLRLLSNGNYLVTHMDMGKIVEYDPSGKEIASINAPKAWSATRLANGNTLIAGNDNIVKEINPKGDTVWQFAQADVPDIRLFGTQTAVRLANGNTLINNWHNKDANGTPVQAIEVTPDKKVVWALQSFTDPNLGSSTTIQLMDTPKP